MPLGGVGLGDPYATLVELKRMQAQLRAMTNTFETIVRNGVVIVDHGDLLNIGTNTHANIDTHIANGDIHFTEAAIDHTAIANIGTNTHAQIDTHIASDISHPFIRQASTPASDGTDGYLWISTNAEPHILYALLNNGSSTAQWVQVQKGNP